MGDWIYCTLYIYTVWDYRQYSSIAILHTFQLTFAHTLGFSVSTSRILATDLSVSRPLQFIREVFLAKSNSFLLNHLRLPPQELHPILFQLLFSTPTLYLLLSCRTLPITTLHGPHGKQSLLLARRLPRRCIATDVLLLRVCFPTVSIVGEAFTAPLHSNRRPTVPRLLPKQCV
jgi:hypothetical protein